MGRCSAEIEEAENGYVVRVSSDGPKGEYQSKRFVATTQPEAQRLAGAALNGKIKVGKKKGRKGRAIDAPATAKKRTARKRS